MLQDFLQGKPFQHPLHSLLVHLPLVFFIVSFLCDGVSWIDRTTAWLPSTAYYTLLAGILFALLAALPGFVDWNDIRHDHPAKRTATLHMVLNLAVVGLAALNVGVRATTTTELPSGGLPLILSISMVALLTVSGYLGGKLVYEHGIGVGRHLRRTKTPDRTIQATANSAQTEKKRDLLEVAPVESLAEGETLRADVQGHIICIARTAGEFYAFQEFCTHLYGPLSEGRLNAGQIQCPWHGSCFDMRSGLVTQGPAQLELKTYEISVQNGKIYVRLPVEKSGPARAAA